MADATDPEADPDPEHPRATFLRALSVGRNARVGFGLGALFAAAVFVRFVYLVDRPHSTVLWLMLAFVLAVGTGFLLTLAFTVGAAYRAARRTADDGGAYSGEKGEGWIRGSGGRDGYEDGDQDGPGDDDGDHDAPRDGEGDPPVDSNPADEPTR